MEENALNLIEKIIKAKKEEQKFIMFGKEMPKVKKYIIDKQCGKYKIKKEYLNNLEDYKNIKENIILIVDSKNKQEKEITRKINKTIKNNETVKIILCINEYPENNRDNKKGKYKNFFRINLDFVSQYNNHLLPASMEQFNFEKLFNEENENKNYRGILWLNSSISRNKDNKIETVNITHKFNLDDTVYLYYNDLPDNIPRVLLKGKVIFNGYYGYVDKENRKIDIEKFIPKDGCWFYSDPDEEDKIDKKDKVYTIRIEITSAIKCSELDKVVTKETLMKYVKNKELKNFKVQGKQYIESVYDKELIKILEKTFNPKSKRNNRNYKNYKDYFIYECAFKDYKTKEGKKTRHDTFIKNNKLPYYECHHLIEQRMVNKDVKDEIIYSPYNQFMLCPICHSKIHNAEDEEVIRMIEYLYECNNKKINKLMGKLIESNNKLKKELKTPKDKIKWIKETYHNLNQKDS